MKELVLVIEDDETLRSNLFEFLEMEEFNVLSAQDGCSGLQLAQEIKPNLIICDINMPNLNGFEVLKKLREDVTTAKIPFIFHTSETDSDSHRRAMQLGANAYLTKPVTLEKFLETVTNQCQLARSVKVKG
ncbi:MAG: response regulator [Cyanobacteriota bacterium]